MRGGVGFKEEVALGPRELGGVLVTGALTGNGNMMNPTLKAGDMDEVELQQQLVVGEGLEVLGGPSLPGVIGE